MRERAVTGLCPAAAAGVARIVVVVLALAVSIAVIVVAGRPVQRGVIVGTGLSYGGQRWRGCGWRGIPFVVCGGGNAVVVVDG